MTMRPIAMVALIFSASAGAADFRFANFGESCANVVEQELAAGSVRIPARFDHPDHLAFKATVFERETEIQYWCKDGKLFTGDYLLPLEEEGDARKTLRSTYDKLNQEYGAPVADNTPWQYGATDASSGQAREERPREERQGYYINWNTPRVSISILFGRQENVPPPAWRTFIHFGSR